MTNDQPTEVQSFRTKVPNALTLSAVGPCIIYNVFHRKNSVRLITYSSTHHDYLLLSLYRHKPMRATK